MSGRDIAVIAAVVVALIAALSTPVRDRLGYTLPFGLESVFRSDRTPGALRIELVPGTPSFTLREQPLYAPDDAWRPWLADDTMCPRGEDRSASHPVQVQVMLCLVNFARQKQGLVPLVLSRTLSHSAMLKANAIVGCGEFEHEACGRPVDEAARRLGYGGPFGENLYMAEGRLVAPRVALDGWLNSDGHRENLFHPEWRTIGIALLADVDVDQMQDGVVWVNQFGN